MKSWMNKTILAYLFIVLSFVILFYIASLYKTKLFAMATKNFTTRDEKINLLIEKLEGFRENAYLDSGGVWTIGIGTTKYPNKIPVKKGDGPITKQEAYYYMQNDLKPIKAFLDTLPGLNENQYASLASFAYNVGLTAFKNSTLLKLVKINPNDEEIEKQFQRWVYDNGVKIKGLANRREQEIQFYFA